VADAGIAAGEHHDAVGIAFELDLLIGQMPDEITEAGDKEDRAKDSELDRHRSGPAPFDRLSKARHVSASLPELDGPRASLDVLQRVTDGAARRHRGDQGH